jgi:hypothetical protein
MTEKPRPAYFFPERVLSRWARYLHDVQNLAIEGAVEPRRWIACAEGLWAGIADDCAAGLRVLGYGDEPPAFGYLAPTDVILKCGQTTCEIPIDVPLDAFRALGCEELSVRPTEFRCHKEIIAAPEENLRMTPPTVTIADRSSLLRVYQLPNLAGGTVLSGAVLATAADPVATGRSGALIVASIRIFVDP